LKDALNGKSIKLSELDHNFAHQISTLKEKLEEFKDKYKVKAPLFSYLNIDSK
jgi:hypothetical protein